MEAFFFASFALAAAKELLYARLEKIYNPLNDVWTFSFSSKSIKTNLVVSAGSGHECIFLSPSKPQNPDKPSAYTQWLRKRLLGRRVNFIAFDLPGRELVFKFTPSTRFPGLDILKIGLRNPPDMPQRLPEDFASVSFPDDVGNIPDNEDTWRNYPYISPLLRKTLRLLDHTERTRLTESLFSFAGRTSAAFRQALKDAEASASGAEVSCPGEQIGPLPIFVYEHPDGRKTACAWELPASLCAGAERKMFSNPLEAAYAYALEHVFGRIAQAADVMRDKVLSDKKRKLAKVLKSIDRDILRLKGFIDLRERADMLKANLYRVDPEARLNSIAVLNPKGGKEVLRLDSRLSVGENMQRWYDLSRKGQRGLKLACARKEFVTGQLNSCEENVLTVPADRAPAGGKNAGKKGVRDGKSLADMRVFNSSDGFTIIRGRNKKANHRLLTRIASSFDLWFHVFEAPGAHVVLRRTHPGQDVPERSLEEAAILAALSSPYAESGKARVISAEARDVKTIKGADLGMVTIRKTLRTFDVEPDKRLEEILAKE